MLVQFDTIAGWGRPGQGVTATSIPISPSIPSSPITHAVCPWTVVCAMRLELDGIARCLCLSTAITMRTIHPMIHCESSAQHGVGEKRRCGPGEWQNVLIIVLNTKPRLYVPTSL